MGFTESRFMLPFYLSESKDIRDQTRHSYLACLIASIGQRTIFVYQGRCSTAQESRGATILVHALRRPTFELLDLTTANAVVA
jgi:hypothetical protein